MSDDIQIVYEDTPATWAVYRDPEGYVGRGKTREAALIDYIDWMEDRWEAKAQVAWERGYKDRAWAQKADADYAGSCRDALAVIARMARSESPAQELEDAQSDLRAIYAIASAELAKNAALRIAPGSTGDGVPLKVPQGANGQALFDSREESGRGSNPEAVTP
jgi:hypothetical protein